MPADTPESRTALRPVTNATSALVPPARMMHERWRHGTTSCPDTSPTTKVWAVKRMPRSASAPAHTAMAAQRPTNTRRGSTSPASMGTAVTGNSSVRAALDTPGTAAARPSTTLSQPQQAAAAPTSADSAKAASRSGDAADTHPGRQPQHGGQHPPRDDGGAGRAEQERLRQRLLPQELEREQRLARHLAPFVDDELVAPELQR